MNGSHIRVVLGDLPIDWASIRGADQINAYYPQRDSHAAMVIRREVVNKNRHALVVYGEGHLLSSEPLGARYAGGNSETRNQSSHFHNFQQLSRSIAVPDGRGLAGSQSDHGQGHHRGHRA